MRYGRVFLLIVILLCSLETIRLWFLAPDVMASHFNKQGNPNNFVPKLEFFSYQARTALIVIALSIVTQVLPTILPAQWINMPNREYWLSPERRYATVNHIGSFIAALFGIVLLMIQAGFELAVLANLQKPIVFAGQIMVPIMVGSFILILILLFWLTRSFQRPS